MSIEQQLIPSEALADMAECLRIIAHPQRLRILDILEHSGDIAVGDIAALCDLPPNQTSEH
ncbi:MAG: ArsR/SmtB family transcription factor, partial [Planctomycetota bacterium]